VRRLPAVLFGALVLATFGAFFVAQNLKNSPSKIGLLRYPGVFSPNQDGRLERFRLTFRLDEADRVTVTILDEDGDPVRELLDDRRVEAYRPLDPSLSWDGRDDDGRVVPDGRYRVRITLRDQGRNVVLPRSFRKDATPPEPRIASMGPEPGRVPEILPLPGGASAVARFSTPALGSRAVVRLFRTGPGRRRQVRVDPLAAGARTWSWDGRLDGRRASPGTYLAVAEWRDEAGNVGTSVPLDAAGLPVLPRAQRLPGRGGITVRYLSVQAPAGPVAAGARFPICVDARQQRFRWTLRRVGEPRPRSRGDSTRPCLRPRAPRGVSGAYVFEARTRTRVAAAPVLVTGRRARPALVVLPVGTWQGRNPADDDGDGAPDTLDRGVSVAIERPLVAGLPEQLRAREAPLLQWLDRTGRRYELTSDVALERGQGPGLAGRQGVLLAGEARWTTPRLRRGLRAFVRDGGRLLVAGPDALRRVVAVSGSGRRLTAPRPAAPTDLFGVRLAPLRRERVDLEVLQDELELFAGTDGRFPRVAPWEEAVAGREADPRAAAVTVAPPGKTVVLAAAFGRGLLLRPGLPDLPTRLGRDPGLTAQTERLWTLLSR
jgi:hypothetical protein